jgi:S-adenosylmethionine synthetase
MNVSVTTRPPYAPPVEFVERKGIGHPDTICDLLAEDLARTLATAYIEHTGRVQAFNVDKAVLAAGSVDIDFGGGVHTQPSRLVLVGKADFSQYQPDVAMLEVDLKQRLLDLLPEAEPDAFTLEIWLSQSSLDLANVVRSTKDVPLANDTSFAAISLPSSPLERAVHEVETRLNAPGYRAQVPVGRDIKVMGARVDDTVRITVACPVMATRVTDRSEYAEVVAEVEDKTGRTAAEILGFSADVRVNQADFDHTSPYLTLSGTSAEAGDDGQVGRGNRFGGLITPYRPMSLEAAAGKNPAAHVGKTYHAVGADIAARLMAETGVTEVTVRLLSSIGHPVTDPQAAHIELVGDHDEAHVASVVKECFEDWQGVRDRLIAGAYELY